MFNVKRNLLNKGLIPYLANKNKICIFKFLKLKQNIWILLTP